MVIIIDKKTFKTLQGLPPIKSDPVCVDKPVIPVKPIRLAEEAFNLCSTSLPKAVDAMRTRALLVGERPSTAFSITLATTPNVVGVNLTENFRKEKNLAPHTAIVAEIAQRSLKTRH